MSELPEGGKDLYERLDMIQTVLVQVYGTGSGWELGEVLTDLLGMQWVQPTTTMPDGNQVEDSRPPYLARDPDRARAARGVVTRWLSDNSYIERDDRARIQKAAAEEEASMQRVLDEGQRLLETVGPLLADLERLRKDWPAPKSGDGAILSWAWRVRAILNRPVREGQ